MYFNTFFGPKTDCDFIDKCLYSEILHFLQINAFNFRNVSSLVYRNLLKED